MRRGSIAWLMVALVACVAPEARPTTTPRPVASVPPTTVTTAAGDGNHQIVAEPHPELRQELLEMMVEDQAVGTGIAPPGDDRTANELFAALDSVDAANAVRMEEILEEYGWPRWSLVEEDGAEAAWVLVQHADMNLELQKRGLSLLEAAVAANDASPSDLAYLIDRVRVAEAKPQVYGTQVSVGEDGTVTPRTPIEAEDEVDTRRAAVGLGPLEKYYAEFEAPADD